MKKINQYLKSVVFAAFATMWSAAALGDGDIYEFHPSKDFPCNTAATASSIVAGDTIKFTLRLVNHNYAQPQEFQQRWEIYCKDNGMSAEEQTLRWAAEPLCLGIVVNGKTEYAEISFPATDPAHWQVAEMQCTYTVKYGDFAMPVRLATDAYGTPVNPGYDVIGFDPATNSRYFFATKTGNQNLWGIRAVDMNGEPVLDGDGHFVELQPYRWSEEIDFYVEGERNGCYDLINFDGADTGYYVKTVDFDPDQEHQADADYWRIVHEDTMTVEGAYEPYLELTGVAPEKTRGQKLYVWSDNENAVFPAASADVKVTVVSIKFPGEEVERAVKVAEIALKPGETKLPFKLQGAPSGVGSGEGQVATLYLSAKKNFTYLSTSGLLLADYRTVKVKCGGPLPSSMRITATDAQVTADEYYKISKTTLAVAPKGDPFDGGPYKVKVVPSMTAEGDDWKKYVSISTSDSPSAWTGMDNIEFTFAPGETAAKLVYVFVLGGGTNTTGLSFIRFTPVIDQAAYPEAYDFYMKGDKFVAADLTVNPKATAITSPENGSTIADEITARIPFSFSVKITDTYANYLAAKNNEDVGYTIQYKTADKSDWTQLSGLFKFELANPGDVVTGYLKQNGSDPKFVLNESGSKELQIQVIPPSGTDSISSDDYKLSVEVNKPATINCSVNLGDGIYEEYTDVNEDMGIVQVKVSDMSRANREEYPIFAFLKPNDEDTAARVTGENIAIPGNTSNMKILPGQTISSESTFMIADGGDPKSTLDFSIVLCKTQKYDESQLVDGYQGGLTIYAKNVMPQVWEVDFGGILLGADDKGSTLAKTIPLGVKRTIQVTAAECEADFNDKSGTVTTEDQDLGNTYIYANPEGYTFYTEVRIQGADGENKTYRYFGDPSKKTDLQHTFNGTGIATVTVRMRDKDMNATAVSKTEYKFSVEVTSKPSVVVQNASYSENAVAQGEQPQILLSLTTAPTANIKVGLKLSVENDDPDNPSILVLGAKPVTGKDWNYEVDIAAGKTEPTTAIFIDDLDGTKHSRNWKIEAFVITEDVNPQTHQPWSEFYDAGQARANIANVAPTLLRCSLGDPATTTNAIPAQIGKNQAISWAVTDNAHDLAAGLTVQWSSSDTGAAPAETITDDADNSYEPVFKTSGSKTVTCTIKDKDGDSTTYTWKYEVTPAKTLKVTAVGPNGGSLKITGRYAAAAGNGAGHVWANGNLTSADSWRLSYLCGLADSIDTMAWGYKVGAIDNGSLDAKDVALDPGGNNPTKLTDFYTYPDAELDSFRYAWIVKGGSAEGGSETVVTLSPEKPGDSKTATFPVELPADAAENGNYGDTLVDAIFAKEWRAADNVGDINQDGIPDLTVIQYTDFGVYDQATGGTAGDDLKSLAGFNEDGDYLPGSTTQGNRLMPNTVSGWTSLGLEFKALWEIRGFHEGLNARYPNGDGSYPDRDFSLYEEMAFRQAFNDAGSPGLGGPVPITEDGKTPAALSGDQEAALTAWWKTARWTPENPSDPTVDDTDKDSMPDGYEYWFWYGATVGYPDADGVWQGTMKGRRFNEEDAENPTEIPSIDIANAFNPTVSGVDMMKRDTDNDGLSDYEEFLMGTNPVDCDTDGDGMIDGWEVMYGLNPLTKNELKSGEDNPDGDYMADATLDKAVFVEFTLNGDKYIFLSVDEDFVKAHKNPKDGEEPATDFRGVCILKGADATRADAFFTLNGVRVPKTRALAQRKVRIPADAEAVKVELVENGNYHLVHDQVFAFFGFDPRTAWNKDSSGHVSPRWAVTEVGDAGLSVNTREFTTLDEFLLFKYRKATGIEIAGGKMMERLAAGTTCPVLPFTGAGYGDSTLTYESEVHGADTDGDGIPDGWELYVAASHKLAFKDEQWLEDIAVRISPNDKTDANVIYDELAFDKLSLVREFAGTDSSIAYATCPTVIANAGSVWPNKFFPTNPWSRDTDGDGIFDSEEGTGWTAVYPSAGSRRFTFNYTTVELGVNPANYDFSTRCFRGGGTNPCTVDTDCDGLPDPWEKQFAGITASDAGPLYTDSLKLADGLLVKGDDAAKTNDTPTVNGEYLIGGMDATFAGDAWTRPTTLDPITGTVRDFDFDGDGLQNYQEYLVQAVRQFRYDDTETPLNGMVLYWLGDKSAENEFVPADVRITAAAAGYSYPEFDFLHAGRSYASVVEEADLLISEHKMLALYTDAANLYANGVKSEEGAVIAEPQKWDFRKLGYFASTPHEWDLLNQLATGQLYCRWGGDAGYKLMLPPTSLRFVWNGEFVSPENHEPPFGEQAGDFMGVDGQYRLAAAGYVSTDPRMRDTDGDGMDDYYELYHGMCPIYGDALTGSQGIDVIARMYNSKISAKANGWNKFDLYQGLASQGVKYDFVKHPWLAGAPDADPDGDKQRNADEMIAGDMTSPEPKHTDPTPLWMTEPTAKLAISRLSYVLPAMDLLKGGTQDWLYYPWEIGASIPGTGVNDGSAARRFMYAFERGEGYDTDGDWRCDSDESKADVQAVSDPLYFGDPLHRAAIYLDGTGAVYQVELGGRIVLQDAYDMFRQFTVECWVKPESTEGEQTLVERGAFYNAATDGSEQGESHFRANFRLSIENGYAKGMYDSSAALVSGQGSCTVVGKKLIEPGVWSHIALTYDGRKLRLYVHTMLNKGNDEDVAPIAVDAGLIPANGIVALTQDPEGLYPAATYSPLNCALVIGAAHQDKSDPTFFQLAESFDGYFQNTFRGHIAEVRIWDGARDVVNGDSAVLHDWDKAMTLKDVADNRDEVFHAWLNGRSRNDQQMAAGNLSPLPAQLMMHYNFTSLPGADRVENLIQLPRGFGIDPEVATELRQPNWWANLTLASTVYTNRCIIPWVQNTVLHLPELDGGLADSMYWNIDHAAYLPSRQAGAGFPSFSIPNSANPYGVVSYGYERYNREFQLNRLSLYDEAFKDTVNRHVFATRSAFIGSSDLVVLGGAWAKRGNDFWDDAGPMTAWSDTGTDSDLDGIPDWWVALYADYAAEQGIDRITATTEDPKTGFTFGQLYARDLAAGLKPGAASRDDVDTQYADKADMDDDGMWDWWENFYGIQGNSKADADADADNDGLSNYQEFLVSYGEVPFGFRQLKPTSSISGDESKQQISDYYLPAEAETSSPRLSATTWKTRGFPGLYIGSILTDHDFMEDWWEKRYDKSYVSTSDYDPWEDKDGDGWSNFAECRAFMWCGTFSADLIDKYLDGEASSHVKGYPQPAIGLKLTYNIDQIQDVVGKGLVVRTMTDGKRVDATFKVVAPTIGTLVPATHYVGGYYANNTLHGFLNPGCIVPVGVVFNMATVSSDDNLLWNYKWYEANTGTRLCYGGLVPPYGTGTFAEYRAELGRYPHIELEDSVVSWKAVGRVQSDADGHFGQIFDGANQIGTIDFRTGEYAVDLAALAAAEGNIANCIFSFAYQYRIGNEWPQSLWLSEPAVGRVREGANTIEAFIDMNADGVFNVGEPYGVVRNVQVGWHKVPEIALELTDGSRVVERSALAAAGGSEPKAVEPEMTVRIVREAINGKAIKERVVAVKTFVTDDRAYLTEADVVTEKRPDLDWAYLNRDAAKNGIDVIESVDYRIESVGAVSNNVISRFTRDFTANRPAVTMVAPLAEQVFYSASPTFTFTADDTATAFSIQVATLTGGVIYDSGVLPLGARVPTTPGKCAYEFKAPLYAGTRIGGSGSAILTDSTSYRWRVVAYNAKFNSATGSDYSAWETFHMDAANADLNSTVPAGYAKLDAVVRYYGPARLQGLDGKVVVEAFENADFTGSPLSRTRVADINDLDSISDITTANARLLGITPGTVYVRAYADLNDNNKWDKYEPWGYAQLGRGNPDHYTPKGTAVEATPAQWNRPLRVVIPMEDTDLNNNGVMDCDEIAVFAALEPTTEEPVDWYEWAGSYEDEAETSLPGDVMAYAETNRYLVGIGLPGSTEIDYYLLAADQHLPVVGDKAVNYKFDNFYKYGAAENMVEQLYGVGLPAGFTSVDLVVKSVATVKAVLVHNQVYQEFGYDYRTANPTAFANGTAVNTKPFTVADKKLVMRYLEAIGQIDPADLALNNSGKYTYFDEYVDALGASNPSQAAQFWTKYTLRADTADSNVDGIPDGWQLYTMFGPEGQVAKATPWTASSEARHTTEGGELTYVQEWDGGDVPTDPWQVSTFKETYETEQGTFTISDKDAFSYHLKGAHKYEDADNDGLLNYWEYVDQFNGGYALDVDNAFTFHDSSTYSGLTGQVVPDYFLRSLLTPKYYLGFKVAAHDFIETWFKDSPEGQALGLDRNRFETFSDGNNNDGWDNWSTARYLQSGDVINNVVITKHQHTFVNPTTEEYESYVNDSTTYEVLEDNVTLGTGAAADKNTGKITVNVITRTLVPRPTPGPYIDATITFDRGSIVAAGSNDLYFTVQSFTDSAVADATWRHKVTPDELETGIVRATLRVAANAYARQGRTRFVAFEGTAYQPGKAYGCATDVDVGWDRVTDLKIRMDKTSPVLPRFIPETYGAVPEEKVEGYVITDEGDYRPLISDVTKPTVITIARRKINGQPCSRSVVFRKELDANTVNTITEADVLNEFNFDLDWHFLRKEVESQGYDPDSITEVMYTVYAATGALNEEENAIGIFTKKFDISRKKAATVSPSKYADERVTETRPEFRFTVPVGYPAYAFQLLAGDDVVFASTNHLLGADADRTIAYRAPVYFGAEKPYAPANLLTNGVYRWRVALLNAKFSNLDDSCWSTPAEFEAVATQGRVDRSDKGTLEIAVRYFGEATISEASPLVVEAFKTADFTGEPAGRTVVFNGEGITNVYTDITNANARIAGLVPGDYYVRAYIDTTNDLAKSIWESWGYQNNVGTGSSNLYTVVSTAVKPNDTSFALVFVEDTDINNDRIPDCLQGMPPRPERPDDLDLDRDGLTLREELRWGTDPLNPDTDGDGFPDGYEVWAGINPISIDYTLVTYRSYDGTEYTYRDHLVAYAALDGDVMADALIKRTVVRTHDAVTGDTMLYVLPEGAARPILGKSLPAAEGKEKVTYHTVGVYRYYSAYDENYWNGDEDCWLYTVGDFPVEATVNSIVDEIIDDFPIHLMHWQVYSVFGFESGVATPDDDEIRADGQVHTRPFFGIDKYLLANLTCGAEAMNANRRWGKRGTCLKVNDADYDKDGIPDGWELYVMVGPENINLIGGVMNSKMAINPWTPLDDFKLVEKDSAGYTYQVPEYKGLTYRDENGNLVTYRDPEWTVADMYRNGIYTADPYNRSSLLPGTGIEDKIVRRFGIETGATQLDDVDNDGLSNWAEYLVYNDLHIPVDSWKQYSTTNVLDYFVKITNGVCKGWYVGEALDASGTHLIADHDFIEDWWEDLFKVNFASRYVYDAYKDADNDGWSNWAETRAGTGLDGSAKLSLVRSDRAEDNTVENYPIPTLRMTLSYASEKEFDKNVVIAAWQGNTASGKPDAVWNVPGQGEPSAWNSRFLGLAPNREVNLNIGPGDIGENHVMIEWYDPNYWIETIDYETNGTVKAVNITEHNIDTAAWSIRYFGDDPTDKTHGQDTGSLPCGWVNYRNGDVVIDFSDPFYRNTDYTFVQTRTKEQAVIYHWDLTRSFWRISWMSRLTAEGNVKSFSLSKAEEGYLREGFNTFVAFIDRNGNGEFDEGEPMGVLRDVVIGWDVNDLVIELSDGSAAFPPISLSGATDTDTVRVIRTMINDTECVHTIWKSSALAGKPFLTEADVIKAGEFDFDWAALVRDAEFSEIPREAITSATYEIYLGTNLLRTVVKNFAAAQSVPTVVSPKANKDYKLLSVQPTFVWAGAGDTTAFVLELSTNETFSADKLVVTNFLPAMTAEGRAFKPEWYVGEQLADDTVYYWHVAELNAKFREVGEKGWSETASFKTATSSERANSGYGRLAAEIRYYGPATNEISDVVVEVYGSADFISGKPIAVRHLSLEGGVSNLAVTVDEARDYMTVNTNVVFDGIAPGEYYVMAFIDANGDGLRQSYETWGYVCKIGTAADDLWSPVPLTVVSHKADVPSGLIIMEDTDVNQNMLPDCIDPDLPDWPWPWPPPPVPPPGPTPGPTPDPDPDDPWDLDPDSFIPGDYMAYEDLEGVLYVKLAVPGDEAHGVWYPVMDPSREPMLRDSEIPLGTAASNLVSLATWWDMYDWGTNRMVRTDPRLYDGLYNGLGTNVVFGTDSDLKVVETAHTGLRLIHAQVYANHGYDSGVASGESPNAKPMTVRDKYMVCRYLENIGVEGVSETNMIAEARALEAAGGNPWDAWLKYTLNPYRIDGDRDDLADAWELYTMFGVTDLKRFIKPSDRVTVPLYDDDGNPSAEIKISPFNPYDAMGLSPADQALLDADPARSNDVIRIVDEFDGGYQPTDPWSLDTDDDGILDSHAYAYHLKGDDAGDDYDGDGLPNYAEYLISEVFKYAKIDPENPRTNGSCIDYFRKVGDLYLGEIFTDHDQVNDSWEGWYSDVANRYIYNPDWDLDNDGWSNYAECRADTNPREKSKLGITDADGVTWVHPEYPVPVIEAKVVYNGKYVMELDDVVFKAWNERTDPNMSEAPDATWTFATIPGDIKPGDTTDALAPYNKYLDRKPVGVQRYMLHGGTVSKGTITVKVLNQTYLHTGFPTNAVPSVTNAVVSVGDPAQAKWYLSAFDRDGQIVTLAGDVIGTVDYSTGIVNVDFGKLSGSTIGDPSTGKAFASKYTQTEGGHDYDAFSFDDANVLLSWSAAKVGTSPEGSYVLASADSVIGGSDATGSKSHGHVCEGLNTFVCFVDADHDGMYTAGELYGFVRGVDVGWQGAKFEVELTESSPVFARVNINDGSNDRVYYWGADSGDVDYTQVKSNDTQVAAEALSGGIYNHVRIVPYAVCGTKQDTGLYHRDFVAAVMMVTNRVVAEFNVNSIDKPYITEADFIKDGKFDIDWDLFDTSEFAQNTDVRKAVGDVTAVKYRIVLGKEGPVGPIGNLDTTTVVRAFSTLIERRYESVASRTLPTGLKLKEDILFASRPTFMWRLDESTDVDGYAASAALYGCSYTAFAILVEEVDKNGVSQGLVYDSGVQRVPVRNREGYFVWTAPLSAGDQTSLAKIFRRAGNYRWKVAMYNAKFHPGSVSNILSNDGWSDYDYFSTAVGQQQVIDDHNYSAIGVAVKYAGPEEVLNNCAALSSVNGKVRVQAFTTADFSGEPVVQTLITSKTALTDTGSVTNNCTLYGLPVRGTYYIRAYIDSNGNFRKDDWESWGCDRTPITLDPSDTALKVASVYIEDADTDQDWLPDAWEFVKHGNLDHENAYVDPDGQIILRTSTYNEFANGNGIANFSKFLPGASLTLFENLDAARLLLQLGADTTTSTIAAIRDAVAKRQVQNVEITSFVVDTENREVKFTIGGDIAEKIAGTVLSPVYELKTPGRVKLSVYTKASLVATDWIWVKDSTEFSLGADRFNDTITVRFDEIDLKDIDFSSGFYQIDVVAVEEK